jgi:hypothetical protein
VQGVSLYHWVGVCVCACVDVVVDAQRPPYLCKVCRQQQQHARQQLSAATVATTDDTCLIVTRNIIDIIGIYVGARAVACSSCRRYARRTHQSRRCVCVQLLSYDAISCRQCAQSPTVRASLQCPVSVWARASRLRSTRSCWHRRRVRVVRVRVSCRDLVHVCCSPLPPPPHTQHYAHAPAQRTHRARTPTAARATTRQATQHRYPSRRCRAR